MRLAAALAACPTATLAQAGALRIGLSSEPTAMDPHYHQVTPNDAMTSHVFETLVGQDAAMKLIPRLATAWKSVDDTTWEFTLRQGAKFSNGQPFTPQDVIFTFCRVMNNEQSIGGSQPAVVQKFASVEARGDDTLVIKTRLPYPLLPNDMSRMPMLWSGIVQHGPITFDLKNGCGVTGPWPTVADFNGGKSAIGTGPYAQVLCQGQRHRTTRNEGYWGDKPAWGEVKLIPAPSAGPRLTGLLAGDFDLIENPAARDVKRISETPGFGYVITPSVRVVYFQFDVARSPSPMVKAADGKTRCRTCACAAPFPWPSTARPSPPASWTAPPPRPTSSCPTACSARCRSRRNSSTTPKAPRSCWPRPATRTASNWPCHPPTTATSTTPRSRRRWRSTCRAWASGLGRRDDALDLPKRAKREFSFAMGGWSSETGEASSFLQYWVSAFDKEHGLGTSNYGGYDNPAFDQVFKRALVTVDPAAREKLLQESLAIALADLPSIPLHFESSIWAYRKGLTYEGRADRYTLAMSAKPAK